MNRSKQVIGIVLIVISILGLIAWEKWGKDQFLYDDVLVLRDNVEPGTVITASMMTTKKMNVTEDFLAVEEKENLIGMETAAFVHKGVPLFAEYFQEPKLSPSEQRGDYALALSQDWILSKPETLSRGDRVFFFCGEEVLTSAYVSAIGTEGLIEVIVNAQQAAKISKVVSEGKKLVLTYQ